MSTPDALAEAISYFSGSLDEFDEYTVGHIRTLLAAARQRIHANLLRECSSEWATEKNDAAVTVHHRMVEGVLCRWWGDGETPKGVAIIDRAMGTAPVDEKLIAEIDELIAGGYEIDLLTRCRTALASTAPAEQREPTQKMIEALRRSIVALDDWLHSYAPEMCESYYVEETQERLNERGTLAYIADVQKQNRAAIAASPQDTQQEPGESNAPPVV